MKMPIFFLVCGIAAIGLVVNTAQADPVVPLSPSKLLDHLPKPTEGWSLKKSQAFNDYVGWPVTTAKREFQGPQPTVKEGAPPQIRIRVTDTGMWPQRLAAFEGFAPGKSEAGEKFYVEGFPAISRESENGTSLIICVANRFLVAFEYTRVEKADFDVWVKNADLQALARIGPSGPTSVPRPIQIIRIDQIHPEQNRSRDLYWSTQEELLGINLPTP